MARDTAGNAGDEPMRRANLGELLPDAVGHDGGILVPVTALRERAIEWPGVSAAATQVTLHKEVAARNAVSRCILEALR